MTVQTTRIDDRQIPEGSCWELSVPHFREIISASQDGIIFLDHDLIVQWSANMPNELSSRLVPGKHITDVIQLEQAVDGVLQILYRLKEGNGTGSFRFRVVLSEKKEFHYMAIAAASSPSPLDGKAGILLFCRDMTTQVLLEAENQNMIKKLKQQERLSVVETMTSSISHDFNSLLHPILAFASMGMRKTEKEVELQSYFNSINIAANRAREVVQKILMFSRPETAVKIPLRMSNIIEEGLKIHSVNIPPRIRLELGIDHSCEPICGDATQLHQVVMNLVTNACQAMSQKGGVLKVGLQRCHVNSLQKNSTTAKDCICLTVSDTGTGMTPDVLERIFTPFYTSRKGGRGTGLGLAIVSGIVQDHGGWIDVNSESGKGTEFRVYLPIHAAEKRSDSEMIQREDLTGSERILVVDPEDEQVFEYSSLLKKLGYNITVCNDGQQAFDLIRERPTAFDMALVGLKLPGISGYRLAMRALDLRPDISIILSIDSRVSVNIQQAKSIGIQGVLLKPFSNMEVASRIRSVFNERV